MCGIVGYIGKRDATPIILESLKKLEYRGYDSAGIAVFSEGGLAIHRSQGKLRNLEARLSNGRANGHLGIGHTRWATHGRPSETNAHPHRAGSTVVVHNGIIENFIELKEKLIGRGARIQSDTDTEIVAHLVEEKICQGADFIEAVDLTLEEIQGSYALVFLNQKKPDRLIVAKNATPIVIGLGNGETFVASDVPALLEYTRKVSFLEDGEIADVRADGFRIFDGKRREVKRVHKEITWDTLAAQKEGYRHFMLKEIHEQPQAITDTLRGRMSLETPQSHLDEIKLTRKDAVRIKKVHLVACGTAWHAALVGKFLIEEIARIPVEVDYGSEFRYREPLIDKDALLLLVSQSGETADTLAAAGVGLEHNAKVVSVCNVVDSSLARRSQGVFYTHAGPEISVASTKAFTTQLTALYLIAIGLGHLRHSLDASHARGLLEDVMRIPGLIEEALRLEDEIRHLTQGLFHASNFLYVGRGINYPIALEGALKLKEISYIHAEGYPAGEMKHGPIALIDEHMPVVALLPRDRYYLKNLSNLKEVESRGGRLLAVTDQADGTIFAGFPGSVLVVPKTTHYLTPTLLTIPLQLLAYHIAVHRGTDVDQPRNLAKSVTVE